MKDNFNILKAVGVILKRCRRHKVFFDDIKSRNRIIKLVYSIHQLFHPGPLSTLMICCYGAKSYFALKLNGPNDAPIVITALFTNEIRHANFFSDAVGREKIVFTDPRMKRFFSLRSIKLFFLSFYHWKKTIQYIRVIGYLNRKHDFMFACRAASTIAYYLRFYYELNQIRPKAIAIVGEGPDGLGLIYSAIGLNISTIYMVHAYVHPNRPMKAQDCDLLFIQGPEAFKNYTRLGNGFNGKVVYMGLDGERLPMRLENLRMTGMKIGVFLTGAIETNRFRANVVSIQENLKPETLVIRPHPETLGHINMQPFIEGYSNVEISIGVPLADDIAKCDLALVGNSSAALEILKSGLPCVYFYGFEQSSYDYCGFVASKLIPEIKGFGNISVKSVRQWYGSEDWKKVFLEYDPLQAQGISKSSIINAEVQTFLKNL